MQLSTKSSLATVALAFSATVTASPVPEPGIIGNVINSVECLVVDVVVKALRAYPSATPFCSSFLQIPTITKTLTVTATSPTTTVLPTVTGTDTFTPVVISTSTSIQTVRTCNVLNPTKRDMVGRGAPVPSRGPSLPSCVAQYQSTAVSKACSCLGIPTPTITQTSTLTLTPTVTQFTPVAATSTADPSTSVSTVVSTTTVAFCPAPDSCGNQGLEWEYLPNTSGPNADSTYSNFSPQKYKGLEPAFSGVTNSIGGISTPGGEYVPIYGSNQNLYTSNFVLNHRGFIYAQQTGTYVFSITGVDDAVYVWVGSAAYVGWTSDNAKTRVTYNTGGNRPGVGTFTISLEGGQYYPVRIIFAQGGGPGVFQLSIQAPDGTTFLSGSTAGSPYLVRYSCDHVTAPQFLSWTSEY